MSALRLLSLLHVPPSCSSLDHVGLAVAPSRAMMSLLAALESNAVGGSKGGGPSPRDVALSDSSLRSKSNTQPITRLNFQGVPHPGVNSIISSQKKSNLSPRGTLTTVEANNIVLPGFGSAIPLDLVTKSSSRGNSFQQDPDIPSTSHGQLLNSDENLSDDKPIILLDKYTEDEELDRSQHGQGRRSKGQMASPMFEIQASGSGSGSGNHPGGILGSSGSGSSITKPAPEAITGASSRVMKLNIRNLPSTASIGSPATTPSASMSSSIRRGSAVSERLPRLHLTSRTPSLLPSATHPSPNIQTGLSPENGPSFMSQANALTGSSFSRSSRKPLMDPDLPTVDEGLIKVCLGLDLMSESIRRMSTITLRRRRKIAS